MITVTMKQSINQIKHLWLGKPSRYVTGHVGQLSLPSLRGR